MYTLPGMADPLANYKPKLPTLRELYDESHRISRDIQEHLTVLYKYASLVDHVTELGASCGNSTSAFVLAKPKTIRTYDLQHHPRVDTIAAAAQDAGIDFKYTVADVREIDIDGTDLLFIDTWHCYEQMQIELERHADKARRYIIMHDTETFSLNGENAPVGIWPAVSEYMREHPQWELHEHRQNNNGLTVFRRMA